jgi:hypothetical protein
MYQALLLFACLDVRQEQALFFMKNSNQAVQKQCNYPVYAAGTLFPER